MDVLTNEFIDYICAELSKIGLDDKDLSVLDMIVRSGLYVDFIPCVRNKDVVNLKSLMDIELQYKTALCYAKGYKANDIILIKENTIAQYEQNNLDMNNKIVINFF